MKPSPRPFRTLSLSFLFAGAIGLLVIASASRSCAAANLDQGWANPPLDARLRAYWWWLNGNVTKEAITRDLEEMKAKGFGGALICDADGSSQDGNERAPHGPTFFTPEWRELYKHALREAARLGLEMSLNIQSGWNLGGPMVPADDAPKKLVWTEQRVESGAPFSGKLEVPKGRDGFYRDLFVLGYPIRPERAGSEPTRRPLQNHAQKALGAALRPFSAPDSSPLFQEFPSTPGEQDADAADVIDLTDRLSTDGTLRWTPPPGAWHVIRMGYTLNDHCRVSTCSQGWDGYALDPFDAGAFRRYWDAVVEPLLHDAGPLAGTALKYLHTDSWEVEVANWTSALREEFRKRCGYDLFGWMPVLAGKIINSRDESNRFLNDFRRTLGDLAIDNHYGLFKEGARRHGLLIHPESGGPHAVPIDAQQCLGFNDAPMSEFWAWSWRHRVGDPNRFFVKQPASAAHVYGRKLVLAEGFTTIGPHWQETLWDNLKPSFDFACTEGLNLLVWHAFVCSPESEGVPGQQYFAGTHLNPLVTWWEKSGPFFEYINRAQFMLQQGLFVADVAYYYGDHVPNFTQLRQSDPTSVGRGYDYDVLTAEALLDRVSVGNGRLALPDGMNYRLLVLPQREGISLPVLRKLRELVEAGATIIGPKPLKSTSLAGYPECDLEVKRLADQLWGAEGSPDRKVGPGRVISGKTARAVLAEEGVQPDFESSGSETLPLSYIHRRADDTDIYFVSNRTNLSAVVDCTFRVAGRAPELWDPITGERHSVQGARELNGRTTVSLQFAPCGSWFVVFRGKGEAPAAMPAKSDRFEPVTDLAGPWSVWFDPKWGGPGGVEFSELKSWTTRLEPGVKFYSGTAIYRTRFERPATASDQALWIGFANLRELAEVKVNGQSCGITWAPPFRLDISRAVRPGSNTLEVEVVNFWPNRIIGDASLPEAQRLTRTNIRKLSASTPLMESGLIGPVKLYRRR
ncbi:MAG: glycosyl hydrolase [Verrucomicrobiia bacterium]